jgi:hypothetical protein
MRQTFIAAAAAFVAGGIATGAVLSQAQPAPPPAEQVDGGPPRPGMMGPPPHGGMMDPPPHGGMMDWMHHHMHGQQMGDRPFHPRDFALIYRQEDRNLAPADVQKIAEAFLLWNGNHTWKVSGVTAAAGGPIGFSLTTPEGSVVAKFTMDPHTGRIQRVG